MSRGGTVRVEGERERIGQGVWGVVGVERERGLEDTQRSRGGEVRRFSGVTNSLTVGQHPRRRLSTRHQVVARPQLLRPAPSC